MNNLDSRSLETLPFTGTPRDRREAVKVSIIAGMATIVYIAVARQFDTSTSLIEGLALWTSLTCVFLARTENIWSMPVGIISVVLFGWYLLDVELVGQGWLQYVYYVPVQFIGWWTWSRGGPGRTELTITRLATSGWAWVIAMSIAGWVVTISLFNAIYENPSYVVWDTSIVVASVVAQTLMTFKKRESWWWWTIPVNISAIGLFLATEAWAFVFLYLVFLANSIWGWRQWNEVEAAEPMKT
jgi:nicotinamide mononucleotide transporter